MISRKTGLAVMAVVTAAMGVADGMLPRIPQPLSYHLFADQRSWLGVANFGDVASNAAFAVVGVWGLMWLLRLNAGEVAVRFSDARERWFYLVIFAGLLLTAFGSGYYHLRPDNARLVLDRLPMTIVFMSLVAALIAERIDLKWGLRLWPVLLAVGAGSVAQWYWSEVQGVGDLRFYATVQAYSVVFLLLALFFPARYTRGLDLLGVAGFYVLAKVLETYDRAVFGLLGGLVSGHTLKHLAAAMAGYWILRMVQRRRVVACSG